MMAKLQTKKVSELPLIIKADVQGSAEAIIGALEKLGNDEVRARIIHSAAGAITESDVLLAKGANCSILGFNVRASKQARDLAEREGVEIRYYAIIYDLIDDIKGVLSGMLAPIQRESFLGNAEVLQVFAGSSAYIGWNLIAYAKNGCWPYPFQEQLQAHVQAKILESTIKIIYFICD
jgi:translation initiation factor IF-2